MATSNEISAKLRVPGTENTVPWFWPFEYAAAVAEGELSVFKRGLETMAEAEKPDYGLTPKFVSPNKITLELHTLRLRDFTVDDHASEVPTIIDAPYAGHTAVIADFSENQSLVRTLLGNGLNRVLVTVWKTATLEMKDYRQRPCNTSRTRPSTNAKSVIAHSSRER